MALSAIDWIAEYERPGTIWYAKRLAANDTLANGTHQYGPYFPKQLLFNVFPAINTKKTKNPDARFDLFIDSHADHREVRAVYYNNRFHDNPTSGRNETRLTNFGGSTSALLDAESTGAVATFVFLLDDKGAATECHVWVCRHETEEELFERKLGPVDPKQFVVWIPGTVSPSLFSEPSKAKSDCHLSLTDIPKEWLKRFPSGADIIKKTIELRADYELNPDERMLRRRECEYQIYQSVEQEFYRPAISAGFGSVKELANFAQKILQSRKSRSGKSLELHACEIFSEEGMKSDIDFSHQPKIKDGNAPDFVFPSTSAYLDMTFPVSHLRMLAAKTTCKDRWRQILKEANRVPVKHLLTLQQGVSEAQFKEMKTAGVQLVVPTKIHESFPKSVRPYLLSLESFLGEVRLLRLKK